MAKRKEIPSTQTVAEAESIAKAVQRPGQTKEQTKLIAKGIEKGIAEYKKRQKSKARQLDKKLKQVKSHVAQANESDELQISSVKPHSRALPWFLLVISWLFFIAFQFLPI